MSSFVDRRQELRKTKRLLEQARLVTLAGPGGVGKTRLALHVAEDVQRAHPDGAWLVELSGLSDPALVGQAVAEALGIRDLSATRRADVVAEHLRQARLLLVLDTCEHVLAGCQQLISVVLPACAGVRVLATSRQRLGIEGEHVLDVQPFPVPGPGAAEPVQVQSDAYPVVQLFCDRAAAVFPGFALDSTNADTVLQVCRRTEGIPLAVELAAVYLRALSPRQLLQALEDRFRILTKGYTGASERHRSLRGMVEWSFGLCTDAERALWIRASVFAGGFALEDAVFVCADDMLPAGDMVDVADALADKSVLQREGNGDSVRYRMLDTLRAYGQEQLSHRGESAHWQARHRSWCQELVKRAAAEFFTERQMTSVRRLTAEHANIRAALASSLAGPEEAGAGLEIAAELRFHWFTSGLLAEGRRWLRLLLDLAPEPNPSRVAALEVAGYLAVLMGEPDSADPLLAEGRALGLKIGDEAGLVKIAYAQGLRCMLTGQPTEAVSLFEESLGRQDALGGSPSVMESLTCSHLTVLACVSGHPDEAAGWHERALAMSSAANESWCRAFALWAGGIAAQCRGDQQQAVAQQRESLRLNCSFGDRVHGCLAIEALAWNAAAENPRHAVRLLGGLATAWHDLGAALFGHVSGLHDQCVTQCQATLGKDGFTRVFDEGRRLSFDELAACALASQQRTVDTTASAPSPLTRREMEVAALVAQGKSNREIAEALVISKRTADVHVGKILAKLGFSSRGEISTWVSIQGRR